MALFQVAGWDLKEKVAFGGNKKEKKNKNKQKELRQKAQEAIKPVEETEEIPTITADAEEDNKIEKKNNKRKSEDVEAETPSNVVAPVIQTQRKLTPLQQKMMAKLSGSRFRWINEQLYTITSESALKLIQDQPSLFDEYHQGFRSQVQSWPENPVDVFVEQVKLRSKRPVNAPGGLPGLPNKKVVIADMGCGEAQLALDINTFFKKSGSNKKFKSNDKGSRFSRPAPKIDFQVHSFDLKKQNERITVADIRNVPLEDGSCTIVVFCLALMGTNFLDFINEAYRILAPRGELWIAEIKSRFSDEKGDEFVEALKLCGFFHKNTDNENKMFTRFEFFKPPKDIIAERKAKLERRQKFVEVETEKEELQKKRQKQPEGEWLLKPCIYKRR